MLAVSRNCQSSCFVTAEAQRNVVRCFVTDTLTSSCVMPEIRVRLYQNISRETFERKVQDLFSYFDQYPYYTRKKMMVPTRPLMNAYWCPTVQSVYVCVCVCKLPHIIIKLLSSGLFLQSFSNIVIFKIKELRPS
jgi:hypothetical protein